MADPWERHLPAGVDAGTIDLDAGGTIVDAWKAQWQRALSAPLLRDSGSARWITAGELEERTASVARRLAAAGAQPGDRVLVSAGASVDLAVAHVGALRAGCVVVPVNVAYRQREVAHIVEDAEPAFAIVDDVERGGWVREVAPEALVTDVTVPLPDGRGEPIDGAEPSDPALIVYTSGTTGSPKGAVLTQANLLAGASSVRLAWQWTDDDCLILALPLFHIHGLGVGLHGSLLAGGKAIICERFDPDEVARLSEAEGTLFFGVPTMYSRLVASPNASALRHLRLCVSGSAPLAPDLFHRIQETTTHAPLERYGMSETLMNISNPLEGERRPGTVGFPLPGVEVSLGDDGEILLRGPNVFAGYWRNDAATEKAFIDGWFCSGDLAEVDADGYHRIIGRRTELIISGGYNVYPREIEDVLRSHPSVDDAAVVGTPSAEWGEVVTAFVVANGAVDEEVLRELVSTELAPYKRPRSFQVVDDLPRNALGKVLRHELRRNVAGGA